MKSKAQVKKSETDEQPKSTQENTTHSGEVVNGAEEASGQQDDADDDLTHDEVRGLEEALKSADRGEPVTLQEFKKMAKKWSAK